MKPSFSLVFILSTVMMLAIAGCASERAMEQIANDCQAEADKHRGMRCSRNHPSFSSLSGDAQRMVAYGVVVEEQRNTGKISQAQAEYMMGEFIARQEAQEAARSQAVSHAMGQAGATLLAIDAMNCNNGGMIYAPPPPMAPMMRTTNCSALGNTLSCTSF